VSFPTPISARKLKVLERRNTSTKVKRCFRLHYVVWVTKYRYKLVPAEVGERVREMVRQVCETLEIRMVFGTPIFRELER